MTGVLLYYIALALIIVLYGVLFPASVALDFRGTNERLRKSAVIIDVLGNVLFAPVWNILLITHLATHRFGALWQTISAVLGYAQQEGKLTKTGRLLVYLLHRLDPYHCEKAIGLKIVAPKRHWWQILLACVEVLTILLVIGSLIAFTFYSIFHINKSIQTE